MPLTVMPVAPPPVRVTFTAVVPVRLAPVRVTGTVVPRTPDVGAIVASVGTGVVVTVKVTVLLVPHGVVMLTVLDDAVAVLVMLNVAVTVVAFATVRPLTVTPVPETVIAVAPVRLVPVRVTGTASVPVPGRVAELGAIEVSVGTAQTVWNSTAPASTKLLVFL
jgi:hypothetical protein